MRGVHSAVACFTTLVALKVTTTHGTDTAQLPGLSSRYVFADTAPEGDGELVEKIARDVGCHVCQRVLAGLLEPLPRRKWHEESLLEVIEGGLGEGVAYDDDALQAHLTQPPEYRSAELRVLRKLRGCNRHFKAELLSKGFVARPCPNPESGSAPPRETLVQRWCLGQQLRADSVPLTPGSGDLLKYDAQKEALYRACERTVGEHASELAESLPSVLRKVGGVADVLPGAQNQHNKTLHEACTRVARCESGENQDRRRVSVKKPLRNLTAVSAEAALARARARQLRPHTGHPPSVARSAGDL